MASNLAVPIHMSTWLPNLTAGNKNHKVCEFSLKMKCVYIGYMKYSLSLGRQRWSLKRTGNKQTKLG